MRPPHERPDLSRLVPLIVGASAAIVAIIVLWVVTSARRDQPFPVDVWWHGLMVTGRTDAGLIMAWIPGHLGGPVLAATTGVVIVATLLVLRWWWSAITIAAGLVLCIAIAAPLARIVARIRPADSLAEVVNTSYPSGHVAFAAAMVTMLALLFRHWAWWVIAVVWVIWMAWSRTYLAAHWLTDVIGGMLLGVAVGILAWAVVETIRRRRAQTSGDAATIG